jgi:hypothetical protein
MFVVVDVYEESLRQTLFNFNFHCISLRMNIRTTSLLDGFDNASVNIYFFLTHAGLRMVSVLPILYLNTVTSLPI